VAHLRAEGARAAEAHGRQHAALFGARHRAAAPDPAADDGDRAQPRRRRAGAPPRGRAAADEAPTGADGGGDARGAAGGAQAVPPGPRPLPAAAVAGAEASVTNSAMSGVRPRTWLQGR